MQKTDSFYKNYELLDCGDRRRLERFAGVLVDRPAKQALWAKKLPHSEWERADVFYDGNEWHIKKSVPEPWVINIDAVSMSLKLCSSGQVGVFPEQILNWAWLKENASALTPSSVLNCFAYTGGSTLFASPLGEVCHVDAARTSVKWSSDNAKLSGLGEKPIRWIVDDVITFMKREVKRGRRYNGFILDPPAFGKGKGGKKWSLKQDFAELFSLIGELSGGEINFVVLSCHDPEMSKDELSEYVSDINGVVKDGLEVLDLEIPSLSGNSLLCGICARFKKC
ncbi:MAG: class I SAM-dependent methyltransferase [Pseudomonadota bacterium]